MKRDKKPYVSVIVPVYNKEKYLSECLDSIKKQTLVNIECIIIDDGSTDNSNNIAKKFVKSDSRFQLYTQNNSGPGVARNSGIAKASGELIAFMDADDYYPSTSTIKKIYDEYKIHDSVVIGGNLGILNRDGTVDYNLSVNCKKSTYQTFSELQNDWFFTRFFYDRDFLINNNISFPNYSRGEDPVFLVNALVKAGKYYVTNIPNYVYRHGGDQRVVEYTEKNVIDYADHFIDLFKIAENNAFFEKLLENRFQNDFINAIKKRSVYKLESVKKKINTVRGVIADIHKNPNRPPFVSIIIPVYNTKEEYLIDCFKSVQNQTDQDFEVILIDDGSSDNVAKFCDEYVEKYSKWRVIHQKNRGLAGARNTGIKHARGFYLVFLDSDDKLAKDTISKIAEEVKATMCDLVYYTFTFFDDSGATNPQTIDTYNLPSRKVFCVDDIREEKRFLTFPISACAVAVRKDFLISNGICFDEELIRCEDYPYAIKCLTCAEKITFVNEGLYLYRQNQATSLSTGAKNIEYFVYAVDYIYKFLLESKMIDKYRTEYYQLLLQYMYHTATFYNINHKFINTASDLLKRIGIKEYLDSKVNQYRLQKRLFLALISKNKLQIRIMRNFERKVILKKMLKSTYRLLRFAKRFPGRAYRALKMLVRIKVIYNKMIDAATNCNYVYVIDFMGSGGAEKVCRDFINSVLALDKNSTVALFITQSKAVIDKSVLQNSRIKIYQVSDDDISEGYIRSLARVITKLKPHTLHVAISYIGFSIINRYGDSISKNTNIFVSDYAFFPDNNGEQTSFCKIHDKMVHYAKKIITDNHLQKKRLMSELGYQSKKIAVYNMPVEISSKSMNSISKKTNHNPLKILFAARLDSDKRPDIALEVAEQLKTNKINAEVDFYGGLTFPDKRQHLEAIEKSTATEYKGTFRGGLASLPIENYDVYLLTSPREGMPNAILEAMSLGLIVLSSPAGGIPFLIDDNRTGFLVDRYDNIESYIEKIKHMIRYPKELIEIRKRAFMIIQNKYSVESFRRQMKKEPGYLAESFQISRTTKNNMIKKPLKVYWWRDKKIQNFGDELTKDIIERYFNRECIRSSLKTCEMIGVGSILQEAQNTSHDVIKVWGSGFISDGNNNNLDNLDFRAVRGKLTMKRINKKVPLGDPGLLANLIYEPTRTLNNKIGIVAHFFDRDAPIIKKINEDPRFVVINPLDLPEKVVKKITGCKMILSSSLHGLIIADSFGIPNYHIQLSDRVTGGEYKFRDYYSGIDKKYNKIDPNHVFNQNYLNMIYKRYKPIKQLCKIQQRLIESFPYRNK